MLNEVLNLNIFGFFLIFARVGTAFILLPGFSAIYVSPRLRLLFALAVSFVLLPVLGPTLPGLPESPAELGLILVAEIAIGAFLGVIASLLVAALQVAGTVIALIASMSNAFIQDPLAEQQSAVVAGFLTSIGIILIFVTDLHHLMFYAVASSYTLFVPGQPLELGDMTELLARNYADSFTLGLRMSAPILLTGFTYYIGLGLLTRLMPQMPVFFIGLPIQIAMSITVLMVTLSGTMLVFLDYYQQGLQAFIAP